MDRQEKFVIVFATVTLSIALIIFVIGMQKRNQLEQGSEYVASETTASEQETLPAKVIMISDAEELQKIGSSKEYPMDGDYALDADIDLSGIEWEPIGGSVGIKGEVAGDTVFSGTFDGQGHVISGLTIKKEGSIVPNTHYAKVGLFGVIASAEKVDYAEVRNIIFTNVNIYTDYTDGAATVGTLAGEVNGYVTIENIVVADGILNVNQSGLCDTVGAGGLIGECRTENNMITNRNISVNNIFNGADIIASGTRTDLLYAGGIIGRIAKSACGQVYGCVNTGSVQYMGSNAFAIAATQGHGTEYLSCILNCYYLEGSAIVLSSEAEACSEEVLKSGELPSGLSGKLWTAKKDVYPMLTQYYESSVSESATE